MALLSKLCSSQRTDMLVTKQQALCHPKPTLCSLQTPLLPSHLLLNHLPCFLPPAWLRPDGWLCDLPWCSAGSWDRGGRRKEAAEGQGAMDRELSCDLLQKESKSAYGQGPLASSHLHISLLQLQPRTSGFQGRWCLVHKAKSIRQQLHRPLR